MNIMVKAFLVFFYASYSVVTNWIDLVAIDRKDKVFDSYVC
jgi:hypothetical protein